MKQAEASTSRMVRSDKKDCEFAMTGSFSFSDDMRRTLASAITESIGHLSPPVDYLAGNWPQISDWARSGSFLMEMEMETQPLAIPAKARIGSAQNDPDLISANEPTIPIRRRPAAGMASAQTA
jgi:hypothetical protein